jgi:hypothetical protein
MLTRSFYTTVSSLSDNWNAGYIAYTHFNALSDRYEALYTTVSTFSAEWGSPYLMHTNRSQVYTHSKAFSGQDLRSNGLQAFLQNSVTPALSTYSWDLNTQQVAFIDLDLFPFENLTIQPNLRPNVTFQNPVNGVNGGLYVLSIKQRSTGDPVDVEFDTAYRFNDRDTRTQIVSGTNSSKTVINFIRIDGLMFGDVYYLPG